MQGESDQTRIKNFQSSSENVDFLSKTFVELVTSAPLCLTYLAFIFHFATVLSQSLFTQTYPGRKPASPK
jgi:hypothetical protein